jgi:hypothetical protein
MASECVSEEFLRFYAQHPERLSLSDMRVRHVTDCSHCLPRLLELRAQNAARRKRKFRGAWLAAACATCLIAGFVLAKLPSLGRSAPQPVPKAPALATVMLDLSNRGTYRGSSPDTQPPLILPTSRLALQLILPRFSEVGPYSVSISTDRHSARSLVSTRAVAVTKEQQTLLSMQLDLSALPAGDYVLSTEHNGDGGAYYYPIHLH